MKTNDFNRYSYTELAAAAKAPDAQQIDIDTLGAWFEQYGTTYWNGEYYDADGDRLIPVYEADGDDFEIVGYTLN